MKLRSLAGSSGPLQSRDLDFVVLAATAAAVVAHVLGATALKHSLWGSHFYAFLPPWAGFCATLLLGIGIVLLGRRPELVNMEDRGKRHIPSILIAVSAALLFWVFRVRHRFLGDADVLVQNLPAGEHWHPREPLTLLIHHFFYITLGRFFSAAGKPPDAVAFDTTALDSVLAGALFVLAVIALARRLATTPSTSKPGSSHVGLIALLIASQGFMQLFFGYVENYSWFTLALALYLCCAIDFLRGGRPLLWAGLVLVCAVELDISGLVLVPSFGFLALWGLSQSTRRRAILRDIAVVVAALLLGTTIRPDGIPGGGLSEPLLVAWNTIRRNQSVPGGAFGANRLLQFINVQLLIGPVAALLFLPLAMGRTREIARDPLTAFFVIAGGAALAVSLWFADPPLGFPRDWDLYAPFAVLYISAAAYWITASARSEPQLRRLLLLASFASVFHTVGWVALNTSPKRALTRLESVPDAQGRNSFHVGYWHLTHGDKSHAREWFERALRENPSHNGAHYHLGLMDADEGHLDQAVRHYTAALNARPDKRNYRLALIDALVIGGQFERAVRELESLLGADPRAANVWGGYSIALYGAGRLGAATAALDSALTRSPGDPRLRRLRAVLRAPHPDDAALADEWFALMSITGEADSLGQ